MRYSQEIGKSESLNKRLHNRVRGAAMNLAILFKIFAGIKSGPVALFSSRCVSTWSVYLVLIGTNSSMNVSGPGKKGQSTSSAGNSFLLENVFANRSAFCLLSDIHSLPSRNGGMLVSLDFLFKSSRFSFHQSLLPLGNAAILCFNSVTYFEYSSASTDEHSDLRCAKMSEPSAAFFC